MVAALSVPTIYLFRDLERALGKKFVVHSSVVKNNTKESSSLKWRVLISVRFVLVVFFWREIHFPLQWLKIKKVIYQRYLIRNKEYALLFSHFFLKFWSRFISILTNLCGKNRTVTNTCRNTSVYGTFSEVGI